MPVSYALSISHFVSSVGADAGFAALIGLAILVLLYFAHAREAATLRSQLAAATQRLEELERRAASGVGPAVVRQPIGAAAAPGAAASSPAVGAPAPIGAAASATASPAAASDPVTASPATVAVPVTGRPFPKPPLAAPAGLGAPALSAATRAVPIVAEPEREAPDEPEPAPAPEREFADQPDRELAGEPARELADQPADGNRVQAPAAAVPLAAPQGTGAAGPIPRTRAPMGTPGQGPALGIPAKPPTVTPPPPGIGRTPSPVTAAAGGNGFSAARTTSGVAGAPRSLLEYGLPGRRRRSRTRWLVPGLVLVALAVVAVTLFLVLRSGATHHKTAVIHHRHVVNIAALPPSVVPGNVIVDVINSTNINQLAHHVAARLTSQGFKEGTLATGSSQSATTTTVGYLAGHRNDALAVAHYLKLPASVVAPAGPHTIGQVCPSTTACAADVIVVAGSNVKG